MVVRNVVRGHEKKRDWKLNPVKTASPHFPSAPTRDLSVLSSLNRLPCRYGSTICLCCIKASLMVEEGGSFAVLVPATPRPEPVAL